MKKLTKNFLAKVKESKELALRKKEELKRKKLVRIHKLLDSCKSHGGPLTETSISLVNCLTAEQLVSEICYLRATTTPNIRQQRRIKLDNGRFKMERFPLHELKSVVRNAIKPECNLESSLDSLLKDVFKQYS